MIGLQTYTIRTLLNDKKSCQVAFEKVKQIGYECVQLSGSLSDLNMISDAARNAGLKVIGFLGSIPDLDMGLSEILSFARDFEVDDIGISGCAETDEEARLLADKMNSYARIIKQEGFSFSYHNHSHEFIRMPSGKTVMDILLENIDFEYVKLMPDTYWLQHGGVDVRYFLEKYAANIDILHLKDMKRTRDGVTFAELGAGNINMPGVVALADKLGFRHLIVEQDICEGDVFESIDQSIKHLRKITQRR